MNRRFNSRLESEVLGVHMCYSILEDGTGLDENALRRSGVTFGAHLEARNRKCRSCFSGFTAVLEEIASSGGVNADAVLAICKRFARNGADSNGIQETPHKGVSCF